MEEDIKSINFNNLFKLINKEKYKIGLITIFFFLVGLYNVLNTKDEFTCNGKILPEIAGGNSNSFGGIANIMGLSGFNLNLGSNTDAIRPDLYPDVLKSTEFFMQVLKQEVNTRDDKNMTFEDYYKNSFEKENQENKKLNYVYPVKDSSIVVISKLTENRIKNLSSRILSNIDRKSGIIDITVTMPDPIVAAQITKFTMNYLTNYIKEYRTKKSQEEVDFLQNKVNRAKGNYYTAQNQKAYYADAFGESTIRFQSADVKRERLEDDYQMTSTFYKELLKQLEEAKLKLQKETPVYKILQPPVVPNVKSGPKRILILLFTTFIGFLVALFFTLIYKKNYKKVIS